MILGKFVQKLWHLRWLNVVVSKMYTTNMYYLLYCYVSQNFRKSVLNSAQFSANLKLNCSYINYLANEVKVVFCVSAALNSYLNLNWQYDTLCTTLTVCIHIANIRNFPYGYTRLYSYIWPAPSEKAHPFPISHTYRPPTCIARNFRFNSCRVLLCAKLYMQYSHDRRQPAIY